MAQYFLLSEGKAVATVAAGAATARANGGHVLELRDLLDSRNLPIRGCRDIFIDGKRWGCVWMEQHGGRGATFEIQDIERNWVRAPAIGHDGKPIICTARTHKHEIGDPIMMAAKARTLAAVPALIASLLHRGLFPDPAKLIAEREERQAKYRAEQQRRDAAHTEAHRKLAQAIQAVAGIRETHGFESGVAGDLAHALAILRHLQRTGEVSTNTELTAEDMAT